MNERQASAAVSLIVTECDSPSVLLLRRARNQLDPWSGHWAFPGGKWEEGDANLVETSIRETYEECGCLLSKDELVKSLPLATAGNYSGNPVVVAPFLWILKEKEELQLDTTEIEEAKWQEIEYLKTPEIHSNDLVIPEYPDLKFAYVLLSGVPLWGFTYRVLMDYLNFHG